MDNNDNNVRLVNSLNKLRYSLGDGCLGSCLFLFVFLPFVFVIGLLLNWRFWVLVAAIVVTLYYLGYITPIGG